MLPPEGRGTDTDGPSGVEGTDDWWDETDETESAATLPRDDGDRLGAIDSEPAGDTGNPDADEAREGDIDAIAAATCALPDATAAVFAASTTVRTDCDTFPATTIGVGVCPDNFCDRHTSNVSVWPLLDKMDHSAKSFRALY